MKNIVVEEMRDFLEERMFENLILSGEEKIKEVEETKE